MFVFACVLGTMLALAPSSSPSPASSAPPEIAHVYTADRSDETLQNAARTTYVVSHGDIARNGYRTIAEALQNVPGVEISPLGSVGANVTFGIRGSGSSEVLVLIDGLPAPGSLSNTVELGNLPTTGVERIEVVEGGGSTLYGTGAVGGIINVITQRKSPGGAVARGGSFGDGELYVNTDRVQISRLLAVNAFALPDGTNRPDSDYAQSALHAGEEWRMGAFDAAVRAGLESDTVGTPGGDTFLSPTSRENDVNENAGLTLTRKTAQSQTALELGGTRQQIEFFCDAGSDKNCGFPNPALDTESRVDFGARNAVAGANEQLLYGVDLSRGVVRSDSGGAVPPGVPAISTNAIAQVAAYAQQRFDTAWGSAYAGVRGERDGSLGGEYSPSAGFVYRLSNEASIKGNAATAFRAPNAGELYFPGFGNPALVPERAKVFDLSIDDSHVAGGASLTWFSNRTNDFIAYDFTTNAIDQIDRALIQGFTLDVRTHAHLGYAAAFNVTDLYRAQNLDAGSRLANDPVLASTLRLDYTAPRDRALDAWGIVLKTSGERGSVNPYAPIFDQPIEYSTLTAYVRFRAGNDALITLRGYNLGNERYAAVAGYPMPGRSFLLEASTK